MQRKDKHDDDIAKLRRYCLQSHSRSSALHTSVTCSNEVVYEMVVLIIEIQNERWRQFPRSRPPQIFVYSLHVGAENDLNS